MGMKLKIILGLFNNLKFKPKKDKILIISHGALGDFIHSIHAIELLNENFDVYLNTKPEYYSILPHIKKDAKLTEKYNSIINFNPNDKMNLFLLKNNTFDLLSNKIYKKYILKNWEEIHWSDYYYNTIKELFKLDDYFTKRIASKTEFIVIHPGSSMKEKNWPITDFIWIGKNLNKKEKVIFLIGPQDIELKDQILNEGFNIFESKNFSELNKLAKKTKLYIGNDSGPMHFFSLYNCKILGIYTIGCADTHYPYSNNSCYYYEKSVFSKFYKDKLISPIKLKKENCLKQINNILHNKTKLEKNFFKVKNIGDNK
jgi:ADP-heptose:LPS heptosyltransferase